MGQDYQDLWRRVANATDVAQAVQTLAEILVHKEGRAFISCLDRHDAELCVEVLDNVSRDPHLLHLPPPQTVSSGSYKA